MRQVMVIPYYIETDTATLDKIIQDFNKSVPFDKSRGITNYRAVSTTIKRQLTNMGYRQVSVKGNWDYDGFLLSKQQRIVNDDGSSTQINVEITPRGRMKPVNTVAVITADETGFITGYPWSNINLLKLCKIEFDPLESSGSVWLIVTVGHNYLIGEGVLDEESSIPK